MTTITRQFQPQGRRVFLGFTLTPGVITAWIVAAIILALGAYATFVRFFRGLGASTALNDLAPWGIWIGFDVMSGVALAAGGFVIAATVHIFHREKYEPLLRPAILTAFLGYLLVVFGLLYDLGQPWRIWHALIYWNPHSVLFEVAWCVMCYTGVLALEFAPIVFERLRAPRIRRILRAITIPLIILGITLSTMHQSSLGSMFLIFPSKLSALWYTPILPLLFFTSAVAVGLAMVTVESLLSARFMRHAAHMDLLNGVARASAVVLLLYALVKVADVLLRGAWTTLTPFDWTDLTWLLELGLTVLLPAGLLLSPRVRAAPGKLLAVQALVVIGVIANRVTLAVPSLVAANNGSYFPAPMEFAVTLALLTAGVVAFALAAKHLPVFETDHVKS
ncbi:MAG: Ni/Fe-hydrogenase cytochrome b subunit [Chloroflexota bacterium]|nr:Ni/Fe-hydrogenase cytochrome b subunit [Chloroflexota bacterium]